MTGATSCIVLLDILQQLMPDARLSVTHERPWYSLTYAGVRLCLSAVIIGERHQQVATKYARILPEIEFNISGRFVADISVSECGSANDQSRLSIDLLLLAD